MLSKLIWRKSDSTEFSDNLKWKHYLKMAVDEGVNIRYWRRDDSGQLTDCWWFIIHFFYFFFWFFVRSFFVRVHDLDSLSTHDFESFSPTQKWTIFKHVATFWMKCPIGTFSWLVCSTRYFYETVIETEIMSQRILPSLSIFSVIRKSLHNKLINLG